MMEEWNGHFELVDPRVIVVDHRYQRAEKAGLISKIASNLDWAAYGALSCYKRGTLFVCIDGQQRLRAALSCNPPPKRVPVICHSSAPIEHEAHTFVTINVDRKSVDSLEKHRGQLVAKDPVALAIERAVERAGFTIGSVSSPRSVAAIASLHYIYNSLGEEGVTQVLVQIRDAWPDDNAGVSLHILRGLCDVIADLGAKYHRGKVTAALSKTSPAAILRKAEGLRFDAGGSKQANIRRAFRTLAKL